MADCKRVRMTLTLRRQGVGSAPPGYVVRPLRRESPAEAEALAALMLDAYRGTIDDEGEGLDDARAEIERTFAGQYGPLLAFASLALEDEEHGVLDAACFVTRWEGRPFVAFMMTRPEAKGRGLGTTLLRRSIDALLDAGHTELHLVVTDGNEAAQHVYRKLGFVERLA